ncbi:outer membrane protein [Rhodovastum atsumiense]|nr:outer membrane beta-barrel protein [Rhodovastum atsumiense]
MRYFPAFLAALLLAPFPAVAEESRSGIYVGAKIGASLLSVSDRRVLQDSYSLTDGVNDYSGAAQSWAMGDRTEPVFGGGVSLGYDFRPALRLPLRLELDYVARDRATADASHDVTYDMTWNGTPMTIPGRMSQRDSLFLQTLMANAWIDIPTGRSVTPYVGGGIGVAFLNHASTFSLDSQGEVESFSNARNATNFAWSVGAGISWATTPHITFDLGYRYIDAGDSTIGTGGSEPLHAHIHAASHDLMVGLRYGF